MSLCLVLYLHASGSHTPKVLCVVLETHWAVSESHTSTVPFPPLVMFFFSSVNWLAPHLSHPAPMLSITFSRVAFSAIFSPWPPFPNSHQNQIIKLLFSAIAIAYAQFCSRVPYTDSLECLFSLLQEALCFGMVLSLNWEKSGLQKLNEAGCKPWFVWLPPKAVFNIHGHGVHLIPMCRLEKWTFQLYLVASFSHGVDILSSSFLLLPLERFLFIFSGLFLLSLIFSFQGALPSQNIG